MSKLSFVEYMKGQKLTTFNFVSVKKEMTTRKVDLKGNEISPASFYVEFELAEDDYKEYVIGKTGKYPDAETGKKLPEIAEDVTHVRMFEDFMKRYPDDIVYENHKDGRVSGTYCGDGFFDVSTEGNVWVTDEPLADYWRKKTIQQKEQRTLSVKEKLAKLRGKGGATE